MGVALQSQFALLTALATGYTSFSRATVASVTDYEGLIRPVVSGEIRFVGTKRVRNSVPSSEDLTHASWTKFGGATAPTATTLTFTASATDRAYCSVFTGSTGYANRTFVIRAKVSVASGTKDFRLRLTQAGVIDSDSAALTATGGTITDTTIGGRAWRYHTFASSADFIVTGLGTDPNVSYLAVGSGASGAHADFIYGTGGGAGGMVRSGTFTPAVTTYAIVVGAPGAGATGANIGGNAGSNVTGLGVTAEGGSAGGGYFIAAGNGVNGGGGGCTLTTGSIPGGTGTNFAGGNGRGNANSTYLAGGGGAGAGGAGGAAADSLGGTGGNGVASSITGASVTYGAGAGGCGTVGGSAGAGGVAGVGVNVAPNAGTDGIGNGGSGASGTGAGATSAPGGKGVFIVGYWMEAA